MTTGPGPAKQADGRPFSNWKDGCGPPGVRSTMVAWLPSYPSHQAVHSYPSCCSRDAHQAAWLAQDTVVISACLKEVFDTRCFQNGFSLTL
ncbi:hypothetical protein PoB_001764000 [Plakobranchus ocellatus]|uniref:Uncharacterized protein n=1 Tax=Plakobranchus ocellatus TaxID=259542 RepID=A0AAV3Z9C1_9GAST|nr:hypothetical protein PoB_001764000 [Plakobranchus ocellatus]